jgi:hypothetical protein
VEDNLRGQLPPVLIPHKSEGDREVIWSNLLVKVIQFLKNVFPWLILLSMEHVISMALTFIVRYCYGLKYNRFLEMILCEPKIKKRWTIKFKIRWTKLQ